MKRISIILAGVSSVTLSGAAFAQATDKPQADNGQLDVIVVTAQRHAESLQDVPIAVTAVTASQLAAKGITGTTALEASVPSLTMTRSGTITNPYLRGVGSNANSPNDEQSVATYIDGVYMATPVGNIFSFNNIERIEVLKGPQGTLFGRNATGGVIQVITRDPKHDPSVEISGGYANYQTVSGAAYMTSGITDNLAADISVLGNHQGEGYGHNLVNGDATHKRKEFSARSKWLFTPTDRTEARLMLDYSHSDSTGNDFQIPPGNTGLDGSTYPGRFNTNTNFFSQANIKAWGAALRLDQDLDFARFVSISAYRHTKAFYALDQDATPAQIVDAPINMKARTFSQEVQLLAPKSSKIDWLIGAFYFNARYDYDPLRIAGAAAAPLPYLDIVSNQRTKSGSVYGQGTYEIVPRVKLTAGLRYTTEKQFFEGEFETGGVPFFVGAPLSQKVDKLTWRFAIDYKLTDGILTYFSYNRGIKSGGFNLLQPGTAGYKPEVLDAYEVGLKTELFDRHLRFNIAAFRYNYKDIQVQIVQTGSVLATNAAAARLQGFDFDFQAIPFENFTLSGGAGFLWGKYTDYKTGPPSRLRRSPASR